MATFQGVGYALSLGRLPFLMFDAVCETEAQARELLYRANADRALERARRAVIGGKFGTF